MPNPKKKHTRHRTGIRRGANWRMESPGTSLCPNCGKTKLPHKACGACGFYKGNLVMTPKAPKTDKPKEGTGNPENGGA
ncbi:MAG: 50S ribosomal protein L32 [Elusimicrobiota bacterium]